MFTLALNDISFPSLSPLDFNIRDKSFRGIQILLLLFLLFCHKN